MEEIYQQLSMGFGMISHPPTHTPLLTWGRACTSYCQPALDSGPG